MGWGPASRSVHVVLPFTLAFAAVGSVSTAWAPRGAVFGVTALAVVSYFMQEIAHIYGWPGWVLDLSVFHLVGNPLVGRPEVAAVAGPAAVTPAAFVGGALLMRRRDLGS